MFVGNKKGGKTTSLNWGFSQVTEGQLLAQQIFQAAAVLHLLPADKQCTTC